MRSHSGGALLPNPHLDHEFQPAHFRVITALLYQTSVPLMSVLSPVPPRQGDSTFRLRLHEAPSPHLRTWMDAT
jgi:hypothetical protein